MFCNQCGTKLEEGTSFCSSCGARLSDQPAAAEPVQENEWQQPANDGWQQPEAPVQQQPYYAQQPAGDAPKDYMTVNIILTVVSVLTCCNCLSWVSLITSIIGIVASSNTKSANLAGDYNLAAEKSKTAKAMWIASAIILGVSILFSILAFAGFSGDLSSYLYDIFEYGY